MNHRTRLFAAALAGALVLAGCGGGDDPKPIANTRSTETSAQSTTTTTEAPKVASPITGEPIAVEVAQRPVVAVKVDNSPQGRPQAGLEQADLVIEEKVEGGVTRFIGVFQSEDAELVGPIRSVRTTDANIVTALGGVFAYSGGAGIAVKRINGAKVTTVSEQEDGASPFTYPSNRSRPYKTFASTARLRKEADSKTRPVPALFDFLAAGEAFAPAGVAPATKATVGFGGRTMATLEWDAPAKQWVRSTNGTAHTTTSGARLAFTNVIIQYVPYKGVGYKDQSNTAVDEAVVVGSGDAVILVDGKQVKAKWTKADPGAVTKYTDLNGAPIKLQPGPTLVTLPPKGMAATIV